jgi:PAS domain S-box-containing protein
MEATKRGYASLASLPLAEDETIFGALNIYSEDANAFDAEEMRLLTELANDLSFGIIHLRMQKKRESLQRELDIKNRISGIFLTVADDEMYADVLRVILDAMESRYGSFGYINEEGDLVCPSMTRDVWDKCNVPEKEILFPRDKWGGLWGRSLMEKRTLYSNTPYHVPEGHIQITRSISTPIILGERLIGHLHIANKERDYGEIDREFLEMAAQHIAPVLSARLEKQRHETARKKADEALKKSAEDLAEAHRIAHIGSYVWDAKSDASHWCDEMYNIFGVRRGEITPSLKAVSEMTHPDDRASVVEKVRIAMAETGQYESEYRIVRPDGSVRHVHSQGEARRNEKGEVVGLIGTLTDITAQKEWERTLTEMNQKLQQASEDARKTQKMLIRSEKLAAMGQLSAGVAHEIKNPLNIIYTSTQLMMMEEGLTGEVTESGKIIMEQVMRAVKIIDNLRDFARERKPETKAIGLCPFIEKTMSLVAYEMKGEGIEIAKEFSTEPIRVMGDEDQLAQVFLNITNNSRDSMNMKKKSYSYEEAEKIGWKAKLTVRTQVEDGKAKISFEDNGIGIPEENREKLFTPFFTTKGESAGTGLGIAIAFGIIENHGGTIEFESEEGKGAVFTVTIPLAGE